MKFRFLRAASLEQLRSEIYNNLENYRSGDFSYLEVDPSFWFEQENEFDSEFLQKLKARNGNELYDLENCKILFLALSSLSPYEARDERLWVYLSHTHLLQYSRERWPIPNSDEQAIKYIHQHFFARNKRDLERNNAISRLWWMSYLCNRIDGFALEDALKVLLFKSDVRANLIERPTASQSIEVFSAVLRRLHHSLQNDGKLFERHPFRRMMKEINSLGGYRMLDCLPSETVADIINEVASQELT